MEGTWAKLEGEGELDEFFSSGAYSGPAPSRDRPGLGQCPASPPHPRQPAGRQLVGRSEPPTRHPPFPLWNPICCRPSFPPSCLEYWGGGGRNSALAGWGAGLPYPSHALINQWCTPLGTGYKGVATARGALRREADGGRCALRRRQPRQRGSGTVPTTSAGARPSTVWSGSNGG